MENQLSITLKNNILFQDVDFNNFNLENIKGQLSTLSEGEILYREGSPADKIFLIVSGEVNLLKKSNIGKTKSFIFSENEYFGHDEFLENINRVSTVVALRDTYLISLSKDEIEGMFAQDVSLKTKLVDGQIEDLHSIIEPEPTSINTELNNVFNSDIATEKTNNISHEEYLDGRIDDAINDMHFEEEKDNNKDNEEPVSFSTLHDKIEQLPNEEPSSPEPEIELVDNTELSEGNFSLNDLDESSINENIPDNIFEVQNKTENLQEETETVETPFNTYVEGLSETPVNREIENFESPDDYEDETDDVEFTLPKSNSDETDLEIDKNDLSFLNDEDDEEPVTHEKTFDLPLEDPVSEEALVKEQPEALSLNEAPEETEQDNDIYMGGISSEDELRKIDELINTESGNTVADEETVENIENEFPSEFNIVDEDKVEDIPTSGHEIDPFLGLGIEKNTEDQSNIEDTVSFEDTISFDEPEIPSTPELDAEPQTDEQEVSETIEPGLKSQFEEQTEHEVEEQPAIESTSTETDVILDPIPVSTVVPEPQEEKQVVEQQPVPQVKNTSPIDLSSDEPNLSATQLKMIIKASEMVNSNLKLDDLLDNIVDVASSLISADRGTLYIVENEKGELWSKVATGDEVKEYHLKIGEGIAGWVAQSGEIVNIKDAQQDKRFNSEYDKASGYTTKSMLCFPVKNKEGIIIGVIQLLNSNNGEFSQLDEEMLNAVSIQIALALEKATLVEQLLQGERVSSLGKMANFLIQDIKKPILVSKRYADHLREKDLPPDIKQVLEMMTDQLNHVADIVQTTSSYSQGNVVLRTVETKIDTLLDDFINRIDSYIRTKSCQIVEEFETDATVKIDTKEFYQCFNHVIKNACDAMPDGGNIKLSTKLEDKKVVLSFSDTGLGIPEGLKDKVFEPFMSHGKREGTGLGLSITKKVVEHHGGTVELESVIGTGTTIIIKLPVVSAY